LFFARHAVRDLSCRELAFEGSWCQITRSRSPPQQTRGVLS
jgi:hypothetical protein